LENWLIKAQELFPELQSFLLVDHFHETPMALWIDLDYLLHTAYEELPVNDDLIGRIYDYASWCLDQPDTQGSKTDLSGTIAFCLIESITFEKQASDDLYRWMSSESFLGFEDLFRYRLDTEAAYCKFRDEFMEKKRSYSGPSRI
jgi:hypothetical protein